MCIGKGNSSYTVCALIFAAFIFCGFAIFALFAFLNLRLLVVRPARPSQQAPRGEEGKGRSSVHSD